MKQEKLTFCIIGAGRIAQIHARNIVAHPRATLKYVVDPAEESRIALARECGASALATVDDALEDPDINAVLIASPTDTHVDYIISSGRAKKAILCEKPIDLDIGRTQAAVETIKNENVPFLTAFNRRFDPNFSQLHNCLRNGDIGSLEILSITSRDPEPPPTDYIKNSGSLFHDMMIHDLDMARFLLGEEPHEINATASCLVSPDIEQAGDVDTALVTLKTHSGKLCQISNSRRTTYGYDQRIEAHGSKGMLQVENTRNNNIVRWNNEGTHLSLPLNFFLERYAEAYRYELDIFVISVLEDRQISPGIEDGYQALKLAEACLKSFREGCTIKL